VEQPIRFEIAKQKSLHGVWDIVVEKAMRRFGMVNTYHYNRIAEDVSIYPWKTAPIDAYNIVFNTYNVVDSDPKLYSWLSVWSTVFRKSGAEGLWEELELFAYDFKRDTILYSKDDCGNYTYRLFRPDTGERAYIKVSENGRKLSADHIERFLIKKRKKADEKELLSIPERCFSSITQACSYIDSVLGIYPHGIVSISELLEAYNKDGLEEPFSCTPFSIDPEYLSYNPDVEYEKVISAVEKLLAPQGFYKNRRSSNFYHIFDDGKSMQCMNFQKSFFALDRKFDRRFTVNITYGHKMSGWAPSDFENTEISAGGERIGHIARGTDYWYELHPGAITLAVIFELLTDIQKVLDYLEIKCSV